MALQIVLHHANRVMTDLGTGHREAIYARALYVALNNARIAHRSEVDIPIMYMGQCVGHGRADLIIDNVIVEIKAMHRPPKEAMGQLNKYVTNLSQVEKRRFQGILLNFGQGDGTVSVLMHTEPKTRRTIMPASNTLIKKSRFFTRK